MREKGGGREEKSAQVTQQKFTLTLPAAPCGTRQPPPALRWASQRAGMRAPVICWRFWFCGRPGGGAWASSFLTIRTLAVLLSPFSFHYFPTSRTIFYYQFHFLKIQANAFFQKQRNTPVPFLQLMLPNYYFDDHNCFIDNEIRLLKFRHCN